MNPTACQRCAAPLHHAPAGDPAAAPLRRKATGPGLCVNCAATGFLMTTEPVASLLRRPDFADVLRAPHVQAQFANVLKVGNADAQPGEIDWETVIQNWALPSGRAK